MTGKTTGEMVSLNEKTEIAKTAAANRAQRQKIWEKLVEARNEFIELRAEMLRLDDVYWSELVDVEWMEENFG
jgi:hypothetical protein